MARLLKTYLLRGGVLLGISALASKLLGLWRDRLVVSTFSPESADLIYAAFRIPDFFYYLLVGATVSVIFIPRLVELNEREKLEYMASFLWGVLVFFGALSAIGILLAVPLTSLFASGFSSELQTQIAALARLLFGSVFLLSISSVFAARLQSEHRFAAIAVAPLLYMGSIALSLFLFTDTYGVRIVGYGALIGALVHLLVTSSVYFISGGRMIWAWLAPAPAWKNFRPDFGRRVFNNAAFQINQTVDVWIASFLLVGSVTAFTLGTTLGHFLMSIVGMSVMSAAFPRFTAAKHQYPVQRKILKQSIIWIWAICIPVSIVCAFMTEPILQFLFNLTDERLIMTQTVFFWTVISLPFACVLPLCSRLFLANDDTLTPLYATITTLTVATALAAYLSLVYFPPEQAILGLALGNFTANSLGFVLFMGLIWWKYERFN
jgi:putative peptidoglycan lipid II flippase